MMILSLQRNFWSFQFDLGNLLLMYLSFAFVEGSTDLIVKVQISKSVINGMCFTHWLNLQLMNVPESIFVQQSEQKGIRD